MQHSSNFTSSVIRLLKTDVGAIAGKVLALPKDTKSKEKISNVGRFCLEGELRPGRDGFLAIDGVEFKIDEDTWVIGILELGASAKVYGALRAAGKFATKIHITSQATRS